MQIGFYQRRIIDDLGCSSQEAAIVEDIMRKYVFHSTLDWVTTAQFCEGAHQAWELFVSDREMFENYYREAREFFDTAR